MYDRKKLSAPLISVLAISLLSLPLFAFLPCDIEASRDSETLEKDYYMRYTLFGDKDDEYYISFDVTQGSEADIYIMTQYEYENHYSDGKDFVASFQRENILSVSAYWTQPDDQQYYLVVDNTDNAHSSDAIPTGDIAYDIEYKNKSTEEAIDNFIEMTVLLVGGCCLIIVVVIVLIIYFLFRKKRDRETVVIQGPQYYPPVQQPQYPPNSGYYYQQAPQYPPVQPSVPPEQEYYPPPQPQAPPQSYYNYDTDMPPRKPPREPEY